MIDRIHGGSNPEHISQQRNKIERSVDKGKTKKDSLEISEQAKKLQEGFIELMEKCNPPELVEAHRADMEKHASWFDKDMEPGKTSTTTYVPGKGLIVEYQGEVKGVIPDKEYAQMYYRYTFGEKADEKIKKGYLGL